MYKKRYNKKNRMLDVKAQADSVYDRARDNFLRDKSALDELLSAMLISNGIDRDIILSYGNFEREAE